MSRLSQSTLYQGESEYYHDGICDGMVHYRTMPLAHPLSLVHLHTTHVTTIHCALAVVECADRHMHAPVPGVSRACRWGVHCVGWTLHFDTVVDIEEEGILLPCPIIIKSLKR